MRKIRLKEILNNFSKYAASNAVELENK